GRASSPTTSGTTWPPPSTIFNPGLAAESGRSEAGAEFPEFGVEAQFQAGTQVGAAGRAAGTGFGADLAFGHQHVPGAPQAPVLVVGDQRLGEVPELAVAFAVVGDGAVRVEAGLGRAGVEAGGGQDVQVAVPEARLVQAGAQPGVFGTGQPAEPVQEAGVLGTGQELDLPERG